MSKTKKKHKKMAPQAIPPLFAMQTPALLGELTAEKEKERKQKQDLERNALFHEGLMARIDLLALRFQYVKLYELASKAGIDIPQELTETFEENRKR